jgi:hypothetical protein
MTQPADRVQQTVSGTPGTGAVTLSTAVAGYQTIAQAGIVSGQTVSYLITDTGNAWEYGQGTYSSSGPTLTRSNILGSSNSGSAISATSAAIISLTLLAEDLIGLPTLAHKFMGGI